MRGQRGEDVPSRIIVSDSNEKRLAEIRGIHSNIDSDVPVEYALVHDTSVNDTLLTTWKPQSLVINATGLGKDAPGSPLGREAVFPRQAVVWDLNYRGKLEFLEQAHRQTRQPVIPRFDGQSQDQLEAFSTFRQLTIHDCWNYFIHGWTQVIAEVFDIERDTSSAHIDKLSSIAVQATRQ
jgi:shikimate 5-dehydrogenase